MTDGRFWLENYLITAMGFPEEGRGIFVWDVRDDSRITLQWIQGMEGTTSRLPDGTLIFSAQVVEWFRDAGKIYYITPDKMAIGLAHDFKRHTESNYVLAAPRNSRHPDQDAILAFLKTNQIPYIEIDWPQGRTRSFDNQFAASEKSIYAMDGRTIVSLNLPVWFQVIGWAPDNSGVFYYDFPGPSLFIPLPPVASPILKVTLPKEYLAPEARRVVEEREARESAITFWVVIGVVTLVTGGVFLYAKSRWFTRSP